jgi:hypothetical protein
MTLDEGLAAKSVAVREKGAGAGRDEAAVNALEVENGSDRWLYLQAGDVVQGGKQDRTIAIDVTLAPHSPPQSIEAFCVERGRWAARSHGLRFSGNSAIVSGNALKMSIQGEKNQARVWEEVARKERAAARKLAEGAPGEPVSSLSASGTYSAIVDRQEIRRSREDYADALLPYLQAADALGIVVAINGELSAADVYASSALFRKLSRKLLDSYALEAALRSEERGRSVAAPRKDAVRAFLKDPSAGTSRDEKVGGTMHRRTQEGAGVVLYEYRDSVSRASSPAAAKPVHGSYLRKSDAD